MGIETTSKNFWKPAYATASRSSWTSFNTHLDYLDSWIGENVLNHGASTSASAATNAAAIEAALSAGSTNGTPVLIPGGTYEVTTDVMQIRYNTVLLGYGGLVILKNTSTTGFVFKTVDSSGNSPPQAAVRSGDWFSGPHVKGILVDMNSKGDVGWMLECVRRGSFEFIGAKNIPATGTYNYNDGNGLGAYNKAGICLKGITGVSGAFYNKLDHCFAVGDVNGVTYGQDGILLCTSSGESTYNANMNYILYPRVLFLTRGIDILNGDGCLIDHPEISNNTTGMYVDDDTNEIRSPYIESCTTGISFGSNANRNRVTPPLSISGNTTNFTNSGSANHVDWEQEIVFTDGDTTPDITVGNTFAINYSTNKNITNFDCPYTGKLISVRRSGGAGTPTIVHDVTKVRLQGSANWAMATGDTLTLRYSGSYWYELSGMDYSQAR